jgi:hypothetical protein
MATGYAPVSRLIWSRDPLRSLPKTILRYPLGTAERAGLYPIPPERDWGVRLLFTLRSSADFAPLRSTLPERKRAALRAALF